MLSCLGCRKHFQGPASATLTPTGYNPVMDMISKPAKYGFEHTLEGCGGTGRIEMAYACNALLPICKNATKYGVFDSVHPSEATNRNLASALRDMLPVLQHDQ